MHSSTTSAFWDRFDQPPARAQERTRRAFALFQFDHYHAGLRFKQVNKRHAIWSMRVDDTYRVLGHRTGAEVRWFWISTHAEYDRVLDSL